MHVDVRNPAALSDDELAVWRGVQAERPELHSPYFCPEFVQLVARHRPGVSVGVLSDDAGVFGFFPFHADGTVGGPIAGQLTDFQGVVADRTRGNRAGLNTQKLLSQCGLTRFHYDHVLASQPWLTGRTGVAPSAAMDLRHGYDAYTDDRRQHGGSRFKDLGRRRRRMERELGELRFVAHAPDGDLLAQVVTWKAEQFIRTGLDDPFQQRWVRDVVTAVHQADEPVNGFAGVLSALYAGDQLVAAHLGMHSAQVWHYWFPTYDHRYNKYSPGLQLLLAMAEEAAGRGMHTLDLGKGDDAYKTVFGNRSTDVAEGVAALPSLRWEARKAATRTKEAAREALKQSPLAEPLRTGLRRLRPPSS
jgi:CelD/BcsL family acetyltransferase involved in cellulose biosynthesis